jgi:GNAT superfamily N-acetyltransferase
MDIDIRKGTPSDMPDVLRLIRELATFEREPEAVVLTADDLVRDGYGKNPLFQTLVAEVDGSVVGMALFYPRYSTWKGPTVHLEDLIVTESYRERGIGKALYTKVLEYSYELGVRRVEWVVLDWNTPAIDFYLDTGAVVLRDWDTAQIDRESIRNYLKREGYEDL